MLQGVAGGGADGSQIVFADCLLLRFAVGVNGAAHRVIAGKGFGGRNTHAGHDHHKAAVRAGRQGFHQIAHAPHAAGAAQQGKRHIGTDPRTDGAQFAHRELGAVQLVQTHQHTGGIGASARHTGAHGYPLVDVDIHARQQPRVVKKGKRSLDGGIFVVGRHKTAGQRQAQIAAGFEDNFLIQVDGLHDHIQIVVAVGQRTHHIQRKIQLGGCQHGYGTFLHSLLLQPAVFLQKGADAVHGGLQVIHAVRIADAGVTVAAGTEGGAGNDGDFLFF